MFLQANSLPDGAVVDSDLCIVGAGAAGITIAHSLRGTNLSLALLESGGETFDLRAQELNAGRNVGLEYLPLDELRLRMFGGTTNHWNGSCNDLDDIDFVHRPWVATADGWPITKETLIPFYKRAQHYLQLGPYDYDLRSWSRILGIAYPSWLEGDLEGGVTQESTPTQFGEAYGPDLRTAGNVRVLFGATALAFQMSDDRKSALRVVVGRFGKSPVSVRAQRFVLAMGGIENARFLLLNGLGNEGGCLGRYFMDHPYFRLMLLSPSQQFRLFLKRWNDFARAGGRVGPDIKFTRDAVWQGRFQNARFAFEPMTRYEASAGIESVHEIARGDVNSPDELFYHIGNLVLDIDMLADAASRNLTGEDLVPEATDPAGLMIGCMMEQLPNPDSRVTLSDTLDRFEQRKVQVALQLCDADRIAAGRLLNAVSLAFGKAGIGRVRIIEPERFLPWPPREISYGSHNMGTTRMSRDPKRGVVDADLRLHDTANVYVAGSSVFPTGGHVPPTLTLVALALRLSDHLRSSTP
jgi:choline dehydrogenase-like flavoprotein